MMHAQNVTACTKSSNLSVTLSLGAANLRPPLDDLCVVGDQRPAQRHGLLVERINPGVDLGALLEDLAGDRGSTSWSFRRRRACVFLLAS
jgi:hypothetical protein